MSCSTGKEPVRKEKNSDVKYRSYFCFFFFSNMSWDFIYAYHKLYLFQFNISWTADIDALLIDDYEVGFSSVSGSVAPDMMTFQSSKHHTHILIHHFGLPKGELFFIILKSISKSNVIGFQVSH